MHTDLNSESVKDGLKYEIPIKKVSIQASLPYKFFNERLATPRVRSIIYVNEDGVLRNRKPLRETEVVASPLNYQKPWPSRKGAEDEELVKYMSAVPSYLQHIEKAESVQEKALNFGVIDWSRLEKWSNNQTSDRMIAASSASSSSNKMVESPFTLTNQSCSYYDRTSICSTAQRNQVSSTSSSNSPSERRKNSLNSHLDEGNSIERDKLRCHDQQSSNHGEFFFDRRMERISSHNLQDRSCIENKASCAMLDDRKTVNDCSSISEQLSYKISHKHCVSGEILHSKVLQNVKCKVGDHTYSLQNGIASTKSMTKNNEFFHSSRDKLSKDESVESINEEKRDIFSKKLSAAGRKWLNRSSSVKPTKSSHQFQDSTELDVSIEKRNSRGGQSPFRRMLSSFLKPILDGSPGPITSLPISEEHQKDSNSTSAIKQPSLVNEMHGNHSNQLLITSQSLLHDEKNGIPLRQALVKLAWKNGQPLFMFSTNENNILVASMKRTNKVGNGDTYGLYTIVMAQECKKKGGIWIGQSQKTKPNALYDVVGHMEVSCSKLSFFDSKNLELSKQFVLFDGKPLSNQGCTASAHSSQLAAIVLKSPYQKLDNSIYKALCHRCECENLDSESNSLHKESFQVEKYPEYSRAFSISAILPSGIHGFSGEGKPSSLIERWKSGGSCDCGGWDEGCRLTILVDRLHNAKAATPAQECLTPDGICRIELFNQGGKTESKHALSLTAFKEGLYHIDFGSSITSLQAFAICIAILHSRSSIDSLECFAKHESLQDRLYEKHRRMTSMQNNGGPVSFESNHPPSSPVGRS